MVNQLETNVLSQQNDIMPWLAEFGTKQMAWARWDKDATTCLPTRC